LKETAAKRHVQEEFLPKLLSQGLELVARSCTNCTNCSTQLARETNSSSVLHD